MHEFLVISYCLFHSLQKLSVSFSFPLYNVFDVFVMCFSLPHSPHLPWQDDQGCWTSREHFPLPCQTVERAQLLTSWSQVPFVTLETCTFSDSSLPASFCMTLTEGQTPSNCYHQYQSQIWRAYLEPSLHLDLVNVVCHFPTLHSGRTKSQHFGLSCFPCQTCCKMVSILSRAILFGSAGPWGKNAVIRSRIKGFMMTQYSESWVRMVSFAAAMWDNLTSPSCLKPTSGSPHHWQT